MTITITDLFCGADGSSRGAEMAGAGWRDRAACIGHDQNLWYPVRGGSNAKALAICEACPVKVECGEYGLSLGCNEQGIWGGMSHKQRRKILRERGWKPPIAHGTDRGYMAHRRRGEDACVECLDAHRVVSAEAAARYRANARAAS